MKRLTRRTALKGLLNGAAVTVALPLLDCFLDGNGTALASGAPLPLRFGTWFWGLGFTPGHGAAAGEGGHVEFRGECKPLAPHRDQINYFANFNTPLDGKAAIVHYSGWVGCRTGSVPRHGAEIPAPTLDLLASDFFGGGTRFRSIDLAATGNPRDSYTARSTDSKNAAEVSPLAMYTRLFGPEFTDPNSARFTPDPAVMVRQSVLAAVGEQRTALDATLGAADRARLDEYFTAVRQVEQRLALQLEKPAPAAACRVPKPPGERPVGTELEVVVANHQIMSELLARAVACNQTRVFNMLYSQALSTLHRRGEAFVHHTLTHEEPDDPSLGYQAEVAWYNRRSFEALATFIQAFVSLPEGDGTVLDNTLIFANSDTNFAKLHALDGIPVMTIGKAGGRLKTGRYVDGHGDPISRIGLTCQQALGMPVERWGTASLQTTKPIAELL
jgi:hypothetical protein